MATKYVSPTGTDDDAAGRGESSGDPYQSIGHAYLGARPNDWAGGETMFLMNGGSLSGEFTFTTNTIASAAVDFTTIAKEGTWIKVRNTSNPTQFVNDLTAQVITVTENLLTFAASTFPQASTGVDTAYVELTAVLSDTGNIGLATRGGATAVNKAIIKGFDTERALYYSNWKFNLTAGGSYFVFEHITFENVDGHEMVELGDANTTAADADVCVGIEFKDCLFRDATGSNARAIDAAATEDLLVEDCTFDNIRTRVVGSDAKGIVFGTVAKNATIRNCLFQDISADGIVSGGTAADADFDKSGILIENCTFRVTSPYQYRAVNGLVPDTPPAYGVYCGENGLDWKTPGVNNILRGCLFENFRPASGAVQDLTGSAGDGVAFHSDADAGAGWEIYRNTFINNTRGITFGAPTTGLLTANSRVYGNLFIDTAESLNSNGGTPSGLVIGDVEELEVYNNTFYYEDNDVTLLMCGATQDIASSVVIKNNIFYGGTTAAPSTGTWTPVMENNLFGRITGVVETEWSDASDVLADPLLDSSRRPTADSPCREAGAWVGVRDHNGRPFRYPPTIGAYELTSGFPAKLRSAATTRAVRT